MERIPIPALMLITDRTLLTPNWTLAQAIAPAVTGGVNIVLFGEIDLPRTPRLTVARFVLDGIRGRAPMICSGDPEFAQAAGAQGVLAVSVSEAAAAREAIGPDGILGVMLRSPESLSHAESARADFVLLNLDWTESASATEMISRFRSGMRIPIIAGIDPPLDAAADCRNAGAGGVCICAPGMSAYNRTDAVRAYARAIDLLAPDELRDG